MKKSHLYTRGGDHGTTSLIGGSRVKKCSARINAYGTIDELCAHLGLLDSMLEAAPEHQVCPIRWIQSRLFDVGTHLAMPCTEGEAVASTVSETHIAELEAHIDHLDAQLEPLRTFILPGGSMPASQCHVCRTVCRRAERLITALAEEATVCPRVLAFVNRLSDYLFVYARFLNKIEGVDEISWQNDCH